MKGDQFFWVALKSMASDPDAFEPAQVDFHNGKPDRVWFTGMDEASDASDCVIAEQITRKETA